MRSLIATVTLNPSLDEWMELPTLRVGELNRAGRFTRYPGGKGINVSRVVAELRGDTLAFALAGGEDGSILHTAMRRLNIPHRFFHVEGSTRNNYKILTSSPSALTEINTEGPPVSARVLHQMEHALRRSANRLGGLALSGSVPPGVPSTIYQRWIRRCRQLGVPTLLDASGAAFRHGMKGRPWVIKPNRQEAEELLGQRLSSLRSRVDGCRQLLHLGAQVVILSLGAEGALLAMGDPASVWLATPPSVRVNSAVGAGDSLVGGFLVGWLKHHSLVEAFRLGVAAGTATVLTPGTMLCRREDVERLLPKIRLRQLA